MSLSAKARRAPLRAVTGAFIVNSGIGKLGASDDTAKAVHGMATGTYPFLGKIDPKLFVKGLGAGELVVGGLLLAPIVSPVIAGAALVGFSGALLNVYWKTPGMHEEGSPRPTQQGNPIAKDVWMFGIGAGLMADGLLEPAHDKHVEVAATVSERRSLRRKEARKAKKAAKKARSEARDHAVEAAREMSADIDKRIRKASKRATKKARKTAHDAELGKRAHTLSDAVAGTASTGYAEARDEYVPYVVDHARTAAAKARKTAKGLADEYGPVAVDKAKQARDAAKDLADEYGPVAVGKAKAARDAAKDLADEYGPVAAARAKQARDAAKDLADEYAPVAVEKAKQARDAAKDLADEYGPVAVERAKQAREAAQSVVEKVR